MPFLEQSALEVVDTLWPAAHGTPDTATQDYIDAFKTEYVGYVENEDPVSFMAYIPRRKLAGLAKPTLDEAILSCCEKYVNKYLGTTYTSAMLKAQNLGLQA